jgi:hypothetical protein
VGGMAWQAHYENGPPLRAPSTALSLSSSSRCCRPPCLQPWTLLPPSLACLLRLSPWTLQNLSPSTIATTPGSPQPIWHAALGELDAQVRLHRLACCRRRRRRRRRSGGGSSSAGRRSWTRINILGRPRGF